METKAATLLQQFNDTIEKWIISLDDYTKYFIEQMKAALQNDTDSEKEMHQDAKAIFENNGFPDRLFSNPPG